MKQYTVCKITDLPSGGRKLVDLDGKSVGIFNVQGEFHALLNYCPHSGGALCQGPVTGTTMPTDDYKFIYGREGTILRCAWHGWEFDIRTGTWILDPKIRAKKYQVTVENDDVVVHI